MLSPVHTPRDNHRERVKVRKVEGSSRHSAHGGLREDRRRGRGRKDDPNCSYVLDLTGKGSGKDPQHKRRSFEHRGVLFVVRTNDGQYFLHLGDSSHEESTSRLDDGRGVDRSGHPEPPSTLTRYTTTSTTDDVTLIISGNGEWLSTQKVVIGTLLLSDYVVEDSFLFSFGYGLS